jgi:MFS family permease
MSSKKPLWHGYKWEMLALLSAAFLLNQADRAIYGVVLPQITVDLQLTESQAGLVATVLFLTMAVLMPFAGFAGDRLPKARLITFCLFLWSVATLFTGVVGGVVGLVLLRSVLTGGAEGFLRSGGLRAGGEVPHDHAQHCPCLKNGNLQRPR